MDVRKVFDQIPEQFDKWRPRYCDELFQDVIKYSNLDATKKALEIGPGTGQATEPILKTGCSYMSIELGENFAKFNREKFGSYSNFHLVNDDFETYDFGHDVYDLVYSAATIQWIPEKIGFRKTYEMLKKGGTFAMMLTKTDEKSANEKLYNKIEEVYKEYFHPRDEYKCKLNYGNVKNYGFHDIEQHEYHHTRVYNCEEYISYIGTHFTHITLEEPYKSKFYDGIRKAILSEGNKIELRDTIILILTRK